MDIQIGTGTYILRDELPLGLHAPLFQLSEIGYMGIELVGFFGHTGQAILDKLDQFGMKAIGDHVPVREFLFRSDEILAERKAMGCEYLTLACSPDEAKDVALFPLFERAARIVRDAGLTPLYHNHDFDMRGEHPFAERLLDAVPELSFEPDVGWMLYAGKDPAVYLKKYVSRCPVIHLKDIYAEDLSALKPGAASSEKEYDPENGAFAFCPTGYGVANVPMLLKDCLNCDPKWLVIDHDFAYARSSYDDLKLSYDYVKALLSLHGRN